MAKKTSDGLTVDAGDDLKKKGQDVADATGSGEPPSTAKDLQQTEDDANESAVKEAEEYNKETAGKVTSTSEAYVNGAVGSSAIDPTKTKVGDRVSEHQATRAKGVDYGLLNNVNAIGRRIDSGNSVLHAYLQSNRRPEMPEYDDRREKALRWQRGIQLLGQLGGLVGDSQTGGEGGITYKREMGKTADDAIKAEIDKVRNAYIEQANLYTEADRLWRKGAYDAYKADVDRLSKLNNTTIPLAADEHMSSSGYIYDTNGRAKGWGGSGRAPIDRRKRLQVLGETVYFQDKDQMNVALKQVFGDYLNDQTYQMEALRAYNAVHPDPNVTEAIASGDINLMLSALTAIKSSNEDFNRFMRDPNDKLLLSWVNKYATLDAMGDLMALSDNFADDVASNKARERVKERATINNAIDEWQKARENEIIRKKYGSGTPPKSDLVKIHEDIRLPNGDRLPDMYSRRGMPTEQLKAIYEKAYGEKWDPATASARQGKAGEKINAARDYQGNNKGDDDYRKKMQDIERTRPELLKKIEDKHEDADMNIVKYYLAQVAGLSDEQTDEVIYEKDEKGNIKKDERGNPIPKKDKDGNVMKGEYYDLCIKTIDNLIKYLGCSEEEAIEYVNEAIVGDR